MYKIYILQQLPRQRQSPRLSHKRIPEAITFPFLVKNGAKRQNGRQNCSRSPWNLDQGISHQNTFRQVTTPSFSSIIEENLSKTNSNFRLITVDQEALFQFVQRQVIRFCAISLFNYLLFLEFESLELTSEYRPCTFLFSE